MEEFARTPKECDVATTNNEFEGPKPLRKELFVFAGIGVIEAHQGPQT
jgi:hypothetical protein